MRIELFLTVPQFSKLVNRDEETIRRHIRQGKITHEKFKEVICIPRSEIKRFKMGL